MFVKLENVFEQHYAPNHMPVTKGIVKVTVGFKLANLSHKMLICMLSHKPLAGMLPTLHACIIGAASIAD